MAKNIYLGVDDKARKMKKAYIGVDGIAHQVKKIYLGVEGKARLAYTSYVPVTAFSLDATMGNDAKAQTYTSGDNDYVRISSWATIKANITPSDATDKTVTWAYSGKTSFLGLSFAVIPEGNECQIKADFDSYGGYRTSNQTLGTLSARLSNGKIRSMEVRYVYKKVGNRICGVIGVY